MKTFQILLVIVLINGFFSENVQEQERFFGQVGDPYDDWNGGLEVEGKQGEGDDGMLGGMRKFGIQNPQDIHAPVYMTQTNTFQYPEDIQNSPGIQNPQGIMAPVFMDQTNFIPKNKKKKRKRRRKSGGLVVNVHDPTVSSNTFTFKEGWTFHQ